MIEFFSKKIFLDEFTPVSIYNKIEGIFPNEITFLFESVLNSDDGNFSYIVIGSRQRIIHKDGKSIYIDENNIKTNIQNNPFDFLKDYYKKIDFDIYKQKSKELNIGLIDGFIGNISYDIVKQFEPSLQKDMSNLKDDINIPDLDLIRPKILLVYSHKTSYLTIITSMPSHQKDLEIISKALTNNYQFTPLKKAILLDKGRFEHSKDKFFNMIDRSKQMIKSGDVFQVLMTNRYTQKVDIDPLSFYRILRSKNPSPYLFLLAYEDFDIVGSSPEVMVKLTDGKILLRPIAGTRKRGINKLNDQQLEDELLEDKKELAEHLMLIDLGRNDVGRVAKVGSVTVKNQMRVERYSHVMHIVSDVEAQLDDSYDMFDLFKATFTAGTMTGAPKIRAMQLIAQFEQLKRSFYSGSIAYFGFDGNMDSAITIRTALIKNNHIIFQAGAGIVADSVNESEYQEVNNKLAANIATLNYLSEI